MMKTIFFVIFAAFLFAAITAYNLQLTQTQNLGDISLADITVMAKADGESGGNQATCYSTYKTPLFGGTYIWVCGSCVQVQAKEYSDAGVCYF